jgi:hypothetical protein
MTNEKGVAWVPRRRGGRERKIRGGERREGEGKDQVSEFVVDFYPIF